MKPYKAGDVVMVELPGGLFEGAIKEVLENYGFKHEQETKYRIQSNEIDTITSARCIKRN